MATHKREHNPFQLLIGKNTPSNNNTPNSPILTIKKNKPRTVKQTDDYKKFPHPINTEEPIEIVKNKPHMVIVKQNGIQYTYTPYKLTRHILQYLFDKKKISFDGNGNVNFRDFPSVIESELNLMSEEEIKKAGVFKSETSKLVKVIEKPHKEVEENDTIKVNVEDFNTHAKYELYTSAKYFKRIQKFLGLLINSKGKDSFELIYKPVDIKSYLVDKESRVDSKVAFFKGINFVNEIFIFDSSKNTLKLQKYTLHRFITINGKNYIIFGYPDPFKMISYYTSKLSDLEISSEDRLSKLRDFWNFINPDNTIVQDENGEWTYWKLCSNNLDKNRDLEQIKYVLDNHELLINMLKSRINKYIAKLLSRNDILLKYEFHIFEILSSEGKIKLESPIKRIRDIDNSYLNLLHLTKETIESLIFNNSYFKINNGTQHDDDNYPTNLLIYARNTGYFHFTAEYIDALPNIDLSYYHLNNIYTIEDLINGVNIWKKTDFIYYVSENKLSDKKPQNEDYYANEEYYSVNDVYNSENNSYYSVNDGLNNKLIGGIGTIRKKHHLSLNFIDFINNNEKHIILFNTRNDGLIICIIKINNAYYSLEIFPILDESIIKEVHIKQQTLYYSYSNHTNNLTGSQFLIIKKNIYNFNIKRIRKIADFNETHIKLVPLMKCDFKKPFNFYNQPNIKFSFKKPFNFYELPIIDKYSTDKQSDGEYPNPSFYIPFISKNIMYQYLSKKRNLKSRGSLGNIR